MTGFHGRRILIGTRYRTPSSVAEKNEEDIVVVLSEDEDDSSNQTMLYSVCYY